MSAAIEAIWQRMVELGESANDLVVAGQREASAAFAEKIASCAGKLETLSNAVSILAESDGDEE